jgi:hypothetical protein
MENATGKGSLCAHVISQGLGSGNRCRWRAHYEHEGVWLCKRHWQQVLNRKARSAYNPHLPPRTLTHQQQPITFVPPKTKHSMKHSGVIQTDPSFACIQLPPIPYETCVPPIQTQNEEENHFFDEEEKQEEDEEQNNGATHINKMLEEMWESMNF